jgi:hydrogenase nickel incorporation protein HypA/HybF
MHEIGIAASVLDAVRAEMAQRPGFRASSVRLRIGELAGVDPESLRFGLDALVRDSDLEPLRIDVDYIARLQECLECNRQFAADRYTLACPFCGSLRGRCIAGDELDLACIEVEEA